MGRQAADRFISGYFKGGSGADGKPLPLNECLRTLKTEVLRAEVSRSEGFLDPRLDNAGGNCDKAFKAICRRAWILHRGHEGGLEDLIQDEIVHANMSVSYPGIVRAWHKHERGQVDHFLAVNGALKICAYDDETVELDEIISTGDNPQIVNTPDSINGKRMIAAASPVIGFARHSSDAGY